MAVFIGTTGNDNFVGGTQDDNFRLWQGGDDTAAGGGGSDFFRLQDQFNAADSIDGGARHDAVFLSGGLAHGPLVFTATTMTNVEALVLKFGSYDLTTDDATVAAGRSLHIDALSIGGGESLTFDGSAELDGSFTVDVGNAPGPSSVTGGAQNDEIFFHDGESTGNGGGGDDSIFCRLSAGDHLDGGAGSNDALRIDPHIGTSGSPFVFSATTMTGFEHLNVGADSYLVLNDGNVAAGATLTIDVNSAFDHTAAIDGSAETDGRFHFINTDNADLTFTGGDGDDRFDFFRFDSVNHAYGGAGNDSFHLGGRLENDDTYDGGAGHSDKIILDGDYSGSILLGASVMTGIEVIRLTAGWSYALATDDGNVAAGKTLYVNGSHLTSGDFLAFDGSQETDGRYRLTGGDGNDFMGGGDGNDIVTGGGGVDFLAFSHGRDKFVFNAASDSAADTSAHSDHIDGFSGAHDFVVLPFTAVYEGTASGDGDDFGDLSSIIDPMFAAAGAYGAVLYTNTGSGALGSGVYLFVDFDGSGTFNFSADLAVDMSTMTHQGQFGQDNFMT